MHAVHPWTPCMPPTRARVVLACLLTPAPITSFVKARLIIIPSTSPSIYPALTTSLIPQVKTPCSATSVWSTATVSTSKSYAAPADGASGTTIILTRAQSPSPAATRDYCLEQCRLRATGPEACAAYSVRLRRSSWHARCFIFYSVPPALCRPGMVEATCRGVSGGSYRVVWN